MATTKTSASPAFILAAVAAAVCGLETFTPQEGTAVEVPPPAVYSSAASTIAEAVLDPEEEAEREYFEAMKQYYKDIQAYYEEYGVYPEEEEEEQTKKATDRQDLNIGGALPFPPPAPVAPDAPQAPPAPAGNATSEESGESSEEEEEEEEVGFLTRLFPDLPLPRDPVAQFLLSFTVLGIFTQGVLFPHGKMTVVNPGTSGRKKREINRMQMQQGWGFKKRKGWDKSF